MDLEKLLAILKFERQTHKPGSEYMNGAWVSTNIKIDDDILSYQRGNQCLEIEGQVIVWEMILITGIVINKGNYDLNNSTSYQCFINTIILEFPQEWRDYQIQQILE